MPKEKSTNKKKLINDPVYGFITIPDEIIFDVIEHRLNNYDKIMSYFYIPLSCCCSSSVAKANIYF